MRRPRGGDERSSPSRAAPGPARRPLGAAREELADGGPLRLARGSQGAATQKGSQLRAGGKAKRNAGKRGPASEGERRDGAPRGATCRQRHCDLSAMAAPLGAPSPRFMRGSEGEYGLPGAAKEYGRWRLPIRHSGARAKRASPESRDADTAVGSGLRASRKRARPQRQVTAALPPCRAISAWRRRAAAPAPPARARDSCRSSCVPWR